MTTGDVDGPKQANGNPADHHENSAERRMANWTIIVGIFTALLFATSAFSDYVIYCELSGNEVAAQQAREERRAYFSLGMVSQIPNAVDKTGSSTVGFSAEWQNLGGTRNKWSTAWISLQYFPDQVPYNFDVTNPNRPLIDSVRNVVGPNGILQTAGVGITHDDATQAATGKGVLLAWGAISYADIFNPEITRHGSFCLKLVPTGTMTNPATKEIVVVYQPTPFRNDCNKSE